MSSFRLILILCGLFLLLGACGVVLPPLSPQQAEWAAQKWPGMTFYELNSARTLYVNRCSGCHGLHHPAERSLEKWNLALNKMAPKAKLTADERQWIERYITAAHENAN
jgi:hypothetical protein